jgi:hypothetical protein
MIRLFLYLAFFYPPINALAECTTVDFRPQLGAPRHQGNSGFCFAHTSADLISQAIGTRVSAMDLGVNYVLGDEKKLKSKEPEVQRYLKNNADFVKNWKSDRGSEPENLNARNILTENGVIFVGGTEPTAIFLANFFGLCRESRLPSKDENSLENHLQEIRQFHKRRMNHGYCDLAEIKEPIGEVREWMAKLSAHSLRNWVNETCGERVFPQQPLIPKMDSLADSLEDYQKLIRRKKIDAVKGREKMFTSVDARLNEGKVVAIGATWNDLLKLDPRHPSGDHSFVIAGRRMIKGECHYFIRNSVGEDSSDYLPAFKRRYEQGGVWVKPSELPSIYSVTYL